MRECLLEFGAGSWAFVCTTYEYKYYSTQNYNFASGFICDWNLVIHTEGKTQGVQECVIRKISGPQEVGSRNRVEKTAQ
jgi:hypothetical protein